MEHTLKFISTKEMTNENAPEGQVLVQYLHPRWGRWYIQYGIGYFNNPNNCGEGWRLWSNDTKINVVAYAILPPFMNNPWEEITQKEVFEKYGHCHPNLGCVGE